MNNQHLSYQQRLGWGWLRKGCLFINSFTHSTGARLHGIVLSGLIYENIESEKS